MVRDAVANVVYQLGERGLLRASSGHDVWESRCPAPTEVATTSLSITRNEFNHVVLECRSSEDCQHIRIVRAVLGWTNEHVYAETADWLISRLGRVAIHMSGMAAEVIPRRGGGRGDGRAGGGSTELIASLPIEQEPGNLPALPDSNASSIEETGRNLEQVSPAQILASLASGARLFRSNDGRFFAQVPVGDRLEIFGLKSAAFRDWLIDGYLAYHPESPVRGGPPRGRHARGPGAIQCRHSRGLYSTDIL